MYLHADTIQAVERYIELGKHVRVVIRQLRYPTNNALKGWYRECEQKLDLSPRYAGWEPNTCRSKRRLLSQHSTRVFAGCRREVRRVQTDVVQLKKKPLGRKVPASMKGRHHSPPVPEHVELERQLESPRRDIRQLQLERDLLNKANEIVKKPGRRFATHV